MLVYLEDSRVRGTGPGIESAMIKTTPVSMPAVIADLSEKSLYVCEVATRNMAVRKKIALILEAEYFKTQKEN